MNFFEIELRKLFDGNIVFDNTVFVGRLCLGDVGKDLRVRVEFDCAEKWNHYAALKVSIMHRERGEIDSMRVAFPDVFGAGLRDGVGVMNGDAPHLWTFDNKAKWLPRAPAPEEYDCLREAVRNYVAVFRSREERAARAALDDKIQIATICVMDASFDNSSKKKGLEPVR